MENETDNKKERKSKFSYVSPERVLSKPEYKRYRELRKENQAEKYRRRMEKLKTENKYSKIKRKYEGTATGRFSKRLTKGIRFIQNPTKQLYQRKAVYISPQKKLMLQRLRMMQHQKQQSINKYDWIFSNFSNPATNQAGIVENEIMHSGYSHATCGDREAHILDFSFNTSNPFQQISNEANFHAISTINPIFNLNREIDVYANLVF